MFARMSLHKCVVGERGSICLPACLSACLHILNYWLFEISCMPYLDLPVCLILIVFVFVTDTVIRAVLIFAEGIFEGESHVV